MRSIIAVLFSVAFFILSQQVVSTMVVDDASVKITVNQTGNGEQNATDYFVIRRRTPTQDAMCKQLNEIEVQSTTTPRTTTTSISANKFKEFCQNLIGVHTCIRKSCKWNRGNCEDKTSFPVVPPATYSDTVHLFKTVMWDHRRTPSRGNAIFWLTFFGGSFAVVCFLALSFFMSPLMACCRRVFHRLKGKVSKSRTITLILPQGKKFPMDDYIVRRRVPRKGELMLKQFLETTRSMPTKNPVATKKEDLESPDSWVYDPTEDKEEIDKMFAACIKGVCPSDASTSANSYNDDDDTTKILNIPPEPQHSGGASGLIDNFVEVICEKENADTYSSNSTRSSTCDGGTATSRSKHEFTTLNATLHELDDVDKSKNVILLNLQSNLNNPSSSQRPADRCHEYIIDRMPMEVEESTV